MKRIALISEYYFPANNAPAARFKPLVDALRTRYAVTIYTSKASKFISDKSIKCNRTPFPENTKSVLQRLIFEVLFSVETFFRLVVSRHDVYYITSPSFFNCLSAYFYCRIFGKRYIIDIRDDYPRVFFDTGLIKEHSFLGRFLKAIEKNLYRNALLVVAATAGLAANIQRIYDGRVYLLRNGFSEAIFNYSPEKYSLFTLVLHGNLSVFQGIDTVIKLSEILKDEANRLQILVVGKGSDDYKLKNLNGGIIKYLGPKPHDEIGRIIERAHVGLSLRKSGKISEDAFPVRAYEYIGVCLPILVTPLSEAGHYIESVKMGFQFDETQVDQIAEKVRLLMDNHELYDRLVANIKQHRLEFSREALSRKFVSFLASEIIR